MRKESIKFIGDLAWFSSKRTRGKYSSPKEALKEHIRYITRKDECVYKYNLSLSDWGRRADSLLAKNSRSRIASKVVFALPNCLSAAEGAELLREFLTKEAIFRTVKTKTVLDEATGKKKRIRERIPVKLNERDFGFAVHEGRQGINKQRNLHAHVVFSSEHNGKKLDINRKELSELHKKWEQFLKEKGYHLKRSPIPNEPYYGPQRLRFDVRARASYQHLARAKRLWKEAVEEEKLERMMKRAVQVQPAEDLLTWDEIAQEEERVATRGERKRESAQSPSPRPSRPQQQPKPVVKPKPVVNQVQPRQPQQPRVKVDLQRPSQQESEIEQKTKDPVRRIRQEVERELAEKKKRERQLANEINHSLKQQARALSESPPPPSASSYPKEKERMEVGMQNLNPFITQEVVEAREQEILRKEQQKQIRQAEMEITYLYRFKDSQNVYKGTLTVKFRALSSWNQEQTKTVAAFLATIVVAQLYGFEYPRESLEFYGRFVRQEAVAVEQGVKEYMSKKGIKPLYLNQDEALKALSVKRVVHVRVRIYESGKLVEQFSFYLTKESFTIMERYAEEVRRRRPPEPGQPGQGQPPEQPDYEEDYDRAPGM